MHKDDSLELNSVDAEILGALAEFRDALKEGVPVEKKLTVRTVHLDLCPRDYLPEDVKNLRRSFNLSQALFALILGVSVKTVRSWEQGRKKPSSVASRFMDEMAKNPDHWRERIRDMHVTAGGRKHQFLRLL